MQSLRTKHRHDQPDKPATARTLGEIPSLPIRKLETVNTLAYRLPFLKQGDRKDLLTCENFKEVNGASCQPLLVST